MNEWKDGIGKRCKCPNKPRCDCLWHIHQQYKDDRSSGFGPVTKFAFLLPTWQPLPTTRAETLVLRAKVLDWLSKGKPMLEAVPVTQELTGNDLIDRWLESRKVSARLKKETVRGADASKIKSARAAFGDLPLSRWEHAQTMIDYVDGMLNEGYNIATPNRILASVIRPASYWGLNQDPPLLKQIAFGKYRFTVNTKAENRRSERCDPEREALLLAACQRMIAGKAKGAWQALHDFIQMAIDLGARSDELFNLRNRDVDRHAHLLTLRRTKRKETRLMPYHAKGRVGRILDRSRFLTPETRIIGARKLYILWVHAVCLVYGLPFSRTKRGGYLSDETITAYESVNLRVHDLRHEAVTWWGLCGVTDEAAQFLDGHKSQSMHGRYSHEQLQRATKELREKVWPREDERSVTAITSLAGAV